jgi:outer membrane translocation and assembly module TamA
MRAHAVILFAALSAGCPHATAQDLGNSHFRHLIIQSQDLPAADRVNVANDLEHSACSPDEVQSAVRTKVRDLGYFDAVVHKPDTLKGGGNLSDTTVVVEVDAGVRYYLGELKVMGLNVFTADRLRKEVLLKSNTVFAPTLLGRSVERIRVLYGRAGYVNAVVTPTFAINRRDRTINLFLFLQEGPPFVFGELSFDGVKPSPDAGNRLMRSWQDLQGRRYDPELLTQWLKSNQTNCPGCTRDANLALTVRDAPFNRVSVNLTFPKVLSSLD